MKKHFITFYHCGRQPRCHSNELAGVDFFVHKDGAQVRSTFYKWKTNTAAFEVSENAIQ